MKVFNASINLLVSGFLNESLKDIMSIAKANLQLYHAFGIIDFFDNEDDLHTLKKIISESNTIVEEPNRAEYGDFQTNEDLANNVALHLLCKNIQPKVLIEPTCGKGNFIVASIKNFKTISSIFGVEIYKPYVWEAKFNIINFYLENPQINKPKVLISHCNVFDFDFKKIANEFSLEEILIIGNPPWVTNSMLGSLNSTNLPRKNNFKNHSGLDAMTGKGNFDIAEFITMSLIDTFQNNDGNLLLLVKNSVVKNIVFDQNKRNFKIGSIEKHSIDCKKEFNVSVEASLLYFKLNSIPEYNCKEYSFYENKKYIQNFGWLEDKFVSNIDTYNHTKEIDGESPFVWRQGLKHDCSNIMELEKVNEHYVNGLNEEIKLENDLVYGILKSSDLKNTVINQTRKYTIVTQKKVGQDTKYIKSEFPKTYKYLIDHSSNFEARKSSIYNNKPSFSIFGIGDYSFKPYKVAISGLYKTFHFTLVLPQNEKPVMLDDTCYLIGFDKIEFAIYSLILLNSKPAMQFLKSITFADAKRTFTKDVLMRIDLLTLSQKIDLEELKLELKKVNDIYNLNITLNLWENFISKMKPINDGQLEMFN